MPVWVEVGRGSHAGVGRQTDRPMQEKMEDGRKMHAAICS
jgi:hypothetical protein